MYFIYILHSLTADKYYVGYSQYSFKRIEEHNNKQANTYTSKYRPWELKVVFECGDNRGIAMSTERFIKKQKSRQFIISLIHSDILIDSLAHLVRVPNLRD